MDMNIFNNLLNTDIFQNTGFDSLNLTSNYGIEIKYFVTEDAWSGVALSAAQTFLNDHRNIIRILQAAICIYFSLSWQRLLLSQSAGILKSNMCGRSLLLIM